MTPEQIKKFQTFVQKELNPSQQEAVTQKSGPMLVVAGAGSGKTRVITARIANLILQENIDPESIIALTFTNKAAREMQERIGKFLGNKKELPFIGTFHSYCLRLLKTNQELLDTPFFSILDQDDQKKLVSGIIQRSNLGKKVTAKNLMYQISQIKNRIVNGDQQAALYQEHPFLQEVFIAYEREKRDSKCLDFDDLLLEGLKLFNNATFKEDFQQTIKHVLVDEYQDTNLVQHALLKHMTLKDKKMFSAHSLCVVGDEDQSIYSWRGATVTNMINFKEDFPKTKLVKIEQNYRSVQPILDVANKVIEHNQQRNPKKLWSEKKGKDRIRIITNSSEYQEGDSIAQLLKIIQKKDALKQTAILYRAHYQSRAIEEALIKNSIPYKIIGGIQFYERKEIKDMLAYTRLVVNPFDRTSFFRVVNTPGRGLGQAFETLFYDRWSHEAFLNFAEVTQALIDEGAIKGAKQQSLLKFISIFHELKATDTPTKVLETVLNRSNYIQYLKDTNELKEAETRIENIKELLAACAHFEKEGVNTLEKFLEEVALMHDKKSESDHEHDYVFMMTLHAAKGLEFDTVILTGLEDGLLPSSRSLDQREALEEERRLFYVGITRAKERLLLSHSRYRYTFGQMSDQMPSRFLREVPENLVTQYDCGYLDTMQTKAFFASWLGLRSAPLIDDAQVFTFSNVRRATSPPKIFSSAKKSARKTITKKVGFKKSAPVNGFYKNQAVTHTKYGVGVVQKVEERGDDVYVSAKFKVGLKKILGRFLKKI